MKNIHLIPTDKPSRIYLVKSNNKLGITSSNPEYTQNFGSGTQNQHIYITSDEETKENTWCFAILSGQVFKNINRNLKSSDKKKIILTTDQDLIKDGVQAIDDIFLEWFVENPSCEFVPIITTIVSNSPTYSTNIGFESWRKEPKQETLEEAAAKYAESNQYDLEYYDEGGYQGIEVKSFAEKLVDFTTKWFEQHKNKNNLT